MARHRYELSLSRQNQVRMACVQIYRQTRYCKPLKTGYDCPNAAPFVPGDLLEISVVKGQDIRHATFNSPDSMSEYATKKNPSNYSQIHPYMRLRVLTVWKCTLQQWKCTF